MNIVVLTPITYDGISFYRTLGPLNIMCRQSPNINIQLANSINWSYMTWGDILFAQRPFKEEHRECIMYAKKCGLKIWVDHDDDLFRVGTNNQAFNLYSSDNTQKVIKQCVEMADVLSVSTEHLRGVYNHKNTVVIPNAYPDYLVPLLSTSVPEDTKIVWRGSNSHNKDLQQVAPDILKFNKANPRIKWHFIGYNPWEITQQTIKGSCLYHPVVDCIQLYDLISKINASIAIVPLEFSNFNLAKSNIAWLEHLAGGAVVIAPNTPEWCKPGVITYEDGKFYDILTAVVKHKRLVREEIVNYSRNYVKNNLLLTQINKIRFDLLKGLMK